MSSSIIFRHLPALAGVFFVGHACAFQPLVSDRTATVGADGNQVELAGTRARADTETARDVAFVYTRGLTDGLDVFVEVGRQSINDGTTTEKGPTNPAIGAKWRFYENERKTSLALKPTYFFPLSAEHESQALGTGKSSYELSLILTQEMGWGAVHANLRTARAKFRNPTINGPNWPNSQTHEFSVAPVWNVDARWKLAVNLGAGRTQAGGNTEESRFGELGAIYSPNENLDFALGFIRETNRNTDEATKTVTAGLTWRFK